MYIYKITNSVNTKVYVGQSVSKPSTRWAQHKHASKRRQDRPLYRDMRSLGIDKFSMTVLEYIPLDSTAEFLNEREKFWIKELQSFSPTGYNLTTGGDGKFYLSAETKARIGVSNSGRVKTEDEKKRISQSLMGNTNKKGKKVDPDKIDNIRRSIIGRKHSEETKLKMSLATRGAKAYNSKPVQCIETGVIYESSGEAGRALNVDGKMVGAVCRGERKTTGGYSFRFVDKKPTPA